eukprot:scaffold108480_cov136-Phaeocystis_antarctica.AAC.1
MPLAISIENKAKFTENMPVRLSPAIRASASTHASMARLRSKLLRLPRLNRTPESCGIAFVIAPAVNERLAGDSLRSTVSAAIMEQLMSSIMPYVRDPPRPSSRNSVTHRVSTNLIRAARCCKSTGSAELTRRASAGMTLT